MIFDKQKTDPSRGVEVCSDLANFSVPDADEIREQELGARLCVLESQINAGDDLEVGEGLRDEVLTIANTTGNSELQTRAFELMEEHFELFEGSATQLERINPLNYATKEALRYLLICADRSVEIPEREEAPITLSGAVLMEQNWGLSQLEHVDAEVRLSATVALEELVDTPASDLQEPLRAALVTGCFDDDDRVFKASIRAVALSYRSEEEHPALLDDLLAYVPLERVGTVISAIEWVEGQIETDPSETTQSQGTWSMLKETLAQHQALIPQAGIAVFSSFISNPLFGYGKQAADSVAEINDLLCRSSGFDRDQTRLRVLFDPIGRNNSQGSNDWGDAVALQASFIPLLAAARGAHPLPPAILGREKIEEALLVTVHELRHLQQSVFISPSQNNTFGHRVAADLNGLEVSLADFSPECRKRIRLQSLYSVGNNLDLENAEIMPPHRERVAHYQVELDANIYALKNIARVCEHFGLSKPLQEDLIKRLFGPEDPTELEEELKEYLSILKPDGGAE